MTPAAFVAKWSRVNLPERAASQEHFIDLCRLLGQPTPAEHDATGAEYAFEKGVEVAGGASKGAKGDRGFADVWWKGKFGWEYKRKDKYKTLDDAYRQLLQYREALESPPLLIVSDIARTEIHTNFTATRKEVHTVALADMDKPEALALLRRAFTDPESFRPKVTAQKVTEEVAKHLGTLAQALRDRGHDPHTTAHFLMKCMFCLFAEDVRLLPKDLFKTLLQKCHHHPKQLTPRLTELFAKMRTGGAFGTEDIAWFNGGLFDEEPALELTETEIGLLLVAAGQEWGSVEPAIFGTLFERSLDPAKRSQIGAHYTSREDILLVVEPVIMEPLRREWDAVRTECEELAAQRAEAARREYRKAQKKGDVKASTLTSRIEKKLRAFVDRLSGVRVLDPACGSGNFLYVAIQRLLDLDKEVITFASRPDIAVPLFPGVRPTQLYGIEINPYAAELAQVVIWIGYLQWMRDNGFKAPSDPVLASLKTIENRDAILKVGKNGEPLPHPAEWPEADFIIGNPPFLGSKVFRAKGLEEPYIQAMFAAHDLPKTSDLCCYWFELARRAIVGHSTTRVGLLATQGIRGTNNRTVLERLTGPAAMFDVWSDRPWVLDGASVRVSIISFGSHDGPKRVDGTIVESINPDLSTGTSAHSAAALKECEKVSYMGTTKGGAFDIEWQQARQLLGIPNASGMANVDVLRPWANGDHITQREDPKWIIDFGPSASLAEVAKYEAPLKVIETLVAANRKEVRDQGPASRWWLLNRPRPDMRRALAPLHRMLATPRVAKHRLFTWMATQVLPDSRLFVFARSDDYFFGNMHSAVHELWSLQMVGWHGVGNDPTYNNTKCFETFPLPWPPGKEPVNDACYKVIAAAAKELDAQRERWLNPPEWIAPIAARIDAADQFLDVPEAARPLIRHSAIMAAAAQDPRLKKRTLTNLYNERPTWLRLAHEQLDRAVLAAYAAVDPQGGWQEDWAEVWTETGAGQPLPDGHALAARRAEVEERVLGNLLRLNGERA
ncbi:MAG TPA: DNA methyltransferase [Phycisphaerales bacterium]|nr:DNA methyltransferase [Phycisphaerales bacterium]